MSARELPKRVREALPCAMIGTDPMTGQEGCLPGSATYLGGHHHRCPARHRRAVLAALADADLEAARAELALRDILQRTATALTYRAYAAREDVRNDSVLVLIEHALAIPTCAHAEALAALRELPERFLELADLDLAEQRACGKCAAELRAALAACGLGERAP